MSLAVLNVGSGDTKLSFDPKKPDDRARAARVVQDMLKLGYAILVQVGTKDGKPIYTSATGFDPKSCEYLITGLPADEGVTDAAPEPKRRGRKPGRLPAATTPAVAVARSAGG